MVHNYNLLLSLSKISLTFFLEQDCGGRNLRGTEEGLGQNNCCFFLPAKAAGPQGRSVGGGEGEKTKFLLPFAAAEEGRRGGGDIYL